MLTSFELFFGLTLFLFVSGYSVGLDVHLAPLSTMLVTCSVSHSYVMKFFFVSSSIQG